MHPLLAAYLPHATAHLTSTDHVTAYHRFLQNFFRPEVLAKAQWPDIQQLGEHIHALQTNSLAKARAFGKPNAPMEHCRQAFE